MPEPTTLFEKIWAAHEVAPGLLWIDLHLVHEVTSPQAFDGLRLAGRTVRRPDRTLATADHNVPTDGTPTVALIKDQLSRVQVQTLEANCEEFGIPVYSLGSERQGIVHVIGPELGEGDCVTFDADLPHHFENPADDEAILLAVVSAGLRRS